MLTAIKFLFLCLSFELYALTADSSLNPKGVVSPAIPRGIMNEEIDYASFHGRVTDIGDQHKVFKIKVENNNIKFFRAGDLVQFKVGTQESSLYCEGNVRAVEDFYFSLYVADIAPCYNKDQYFRRGTILNFYSETLAKRIFEGGQYRQMLAQRKEDFLSQLNGVNQFLFGFPQERLNVAAEFDARIAQMEREKQEALSGLIKKKQEQLVLQNELRRRLNQLDENLNHYYVERQELLLDRFKHDHDRGLPFDYRPQKLKPR